MLAKVITLTHSRPSQGFGPVLRYLLRVEAERASPSRPTPESGHLNLTEEPYWQAAEDPGGYAEDVAHIFDAQVRECRRRGRFRGNHVYHVSINWKEGEHPTLRQAERASRHVMQTLGFAECQAVFSIHRDTDHDHVHLVVNRAHPRKLTAVSVTQRDYFLLDRCMRELELEFGCARAHGPYITVETAEGPKIVRMSRVERVARGLLRNPESPRITAHAQRAEQNLTAASFQRWLTDRPSATLRRVISARGATWQDVHEMLAGLGCALQPKGSGLVVTTTLSNGRVLAAKASLLGRWASKASLERVLGPYTDSASSTSRRADPRRSYERFIERARLGENRPRRVWDDTERLARRAERAEARRKLAERFAQEQAQLRERRQREREALQRRQVAERRELTETLPRAEVWRGWLERQAAARDAAARAALRGIRYRERRKQRGEAGIGGEELAPQRPFTVGSLRAEIDAARRIVIYRRADGSEVFRDVGPQIVMREKGDQSVEAALRVAAQKYGGRVRVTGSERFRERAARLATRLDIVVENAELQDVVREERRRGAVHRTEPHAARTLSPDNPRRARPDRSRGPER